MGIFYKTPKSPTKAPPPPKPPAPKPPKLPAPKSGASNGAKEVPFGSGDTESGSVNE